jgi:hypothetical protein
MSATNPEVGLHTDSFEKQEGKEYLPERVVSLDQYDPFPDEDLLFTARFEGSSTFLDTSTDEVTENAHFYDIEVLGYLENVEGDYGDYSATIKPIPTEEAKAIEDMLRDESKVELVGEIAYRSI